MSVGGGKWAEKDEDEGKDKSEVVRKLVKMEDLATGNLPVSNEADYLSDLYFS